MCGKIYEYSSRNMRGNVCAHTRTEVISGQEKKKKKKVNRSHYLREHKPICCLLEIHLWATQYTTLTLSIQLLY